MSKRLAQSLCLPRSRHNVRISGIAGLSHQSPMQSIATFNVCPVNSTTKDIPMTAIVDPRVTCDLPTEPNHFNSRCTHLSNLSLADPDFGRPGRIDILLGVEVCANVLLHGRWSGQSDSPSAFETMFGCVLAGRTSCLTPTHDCLSPCLYHILR